MRCNRRSSSYMGIKRWIFIFVQYIFALVMVWLFCVKELGSFPANRTTKCSQNARPRSTTFVTNARAQPLSHNLLDGFEQRITTGIVLYLHRENNELSMTLANGDVCIHPTRHTSTLVYMHTINLLARVTVVFADIELRSATRSIQTHSTRLRCVCAVFALSLAWAWTKEEAAKKKKKTTKMW